MNEIATRLSKCMSQSIPVGIAGTVMYGNKAARCLIFCCCITISKLVRCGGVSSPGNGSKYNNVVHAIV